MFYLRTWEDDALRKKAWLVTEETFPSSSTWSIIEEMSWIMIQNNLEYLTAPQIGVSRQIIILNEDNKIEVIVNPTIRDKSENIAFCNEKCPSIPGQNYSVPRYQWLVIDYEDYYGRQASFQAKGSQARTLQHAIDHLNGRLICDFEK